MIRLVNVKTGAVVRVADEKAERMGAEWQAEKPASKAPAKKAAPRKRAAKKSDEQ